ncbi:MAG: hypothetical protein C0624_01110 [Desulfuromonas sp.]|nr:MAG: hypothetical protein C0624_01110 [Desulfuromonas sp.]
MRFLQLLLTGLLFTASPSFAGETPSQPPDEATVMEQLSSEDLEILQMLELLELFDLLGDIDTLVHLEDES